MIPSGQRSMSSFVPRRYTHVSPLLPRQHDVCARLLGLANANYRLLAATREVISTENSFRQRSLRSASTAVLAQVSRHTLTACADFSKTFAAPASTLAGRNVPRRLRTDPHMRTDDPILCRRSMPFRARQDSWHHPCANSTRLSRRGFTAG